jgi:hypothetical protein
MNMATSNQAAWHDDPNLSATWKLRFDFYAQYGPPGLKKPSAEFIAAYRALPFGDRIKLIGNVWAFFFSFIYLFVLGMKRLAVLTLGVFVALVVVDVVLEMVAPGMIGSIIARMLHFTYAFVVARCANAWYYEYYKQRAADGQRTGSQDA